MAARSLARTEPDQPLRIVSNFAICLLVSVVGAATLIPQRLALYGKSAICKAYYTISALGEQFQRRR